MNDSASNDQKKGTTVTRMEIHRQRLTTLWKRNQINSRYTQFLCLSYSKLPTQLASSFVRCWWHLFQLNEHNIFHLSARANQPPFNLVANNYISTSFLSFCVRVFLTIESLSLSLGLFLLGCHCRHALNEIESWMENER